MDDLEEAAPTAQACEAVGRYVYEVIERFMGAEPGTAEANELAYLSTLVAYVEGREWRH